MQNEKSLILKNNYLQGRIMKKDRTINNWSDYYAVGSGAYLYFFKDQKDLNPE